MNKFHEKSVWQVLKLAAKEGMAEGRGKAQLEGEARRAARAQLREEEKARRNSR